MNFHQIFPFQQDSIEKIHRSYILSFPFDERRTDADFLKLFGKNDVKVLMAEKEGEEVGYLILWFFEDYIFLEHFEIFEEFRNQKLGSEILENISKKHPKIILESEPSNLNEIARKRIDFYQRNGFSIVTENYIQPSYGLGKSKLFLFLLSNFAVQNIDFTVIEIHEKVYQTK